MTIEVKQNYIKSPLNYIGGKYRLLGQILPLFPQKIKTFFDLFAGGCNVGINTDAASLCFNDNLTYLVDMYKAFLEKGMYRTLDHVEKRIFEFDLSKTNRDGYLKLRKLYNIKRDPLDLFVLIAYSFNHQIRFNNLHDFNNPFGTNKSSFNNNMRNNLISFISRLEACDVYFSDKRFQDFDFTQITEDDFVYCDPPYLITTGTYNDGRRGFGGWSDTDEYQLLAVLDNLHKKSVRFALSNVLLHKGKFNYILNDWLDKNPAFCVNHINYNYSNSNYQTLVRDVSATKEVLITNYKPDIRSEKDLFSCLEY
ncbi:Modification methylase FokI [Limihaloglobus sulfuriphilus]|uniref:Site-specific DNA-methyltransferase (adenine-specific) n=1 Tax=Limihaloglobus sulfuriphilus TaxID=1851148 RepID=A0A1Q2MDJ5_9BACT|nr:DNA adenine methylase [Limihaloglobus sulfuriphilus]AQQ70387.1 Modification methylase FokI [Limihaloglobus sulfuriphilus]